jgi:hypothetical protein
LLNSITRSKLIIPINAEKDVTKTMVVPDMTTLGLKSFEEIKNLAI